MSFLFYTKLSWFTKSVIFNNSNYQYTLVGTSYSVNDQEKSHSLCISLKFQVDDRNKILFELKCNRMLQYRWVKVKVLKIINTCFPLSVSIAKYYYIWHGSQTVTRHCKVKMENVCKYKYKRPRATVLLVFCCYVCKVKVHVQKKKVFSY